MLAKYNDILLYYLKTIVNLIVKRLKQLWSKQERLILGETGPAFVESNFVTASNYCNLSYALIPKHCEVGLSLSCLLAHILRSPQKISRQLTGPIRPIYSSQLIRRNITFGYNIALRMFQEIWGGSIWCVNTNTICSYGRTPATHGIDCGSISWWKTLDKIKCVIHISGLTLQIQNYITLDNKSQTYYYVLRRGNLAKDEYLCCNQTVSQICLFTIFVDIFSNY